MDKQVKLVQEEIRDLKAERDRLRATASPEEEKAQALKAPKPKRAKQSRVKGKPSSEPSSKDVPAQ